MFITGLGVGLLVGGAVGVVTMALCVAAGKEARNEGDGMLKKHSILESAEMENEENENSD